MYGSRRYFQLLPKICIYHGVDTAGEQAICEHPGFEVLDWDTKKNMLYNREELLKNWFLVK